MNEKTHFGFEEVDVSQKAKRVAGVFSSVANRYDIMNDAMSGGIHRLWKDQMICTLNPRSGSHLLDVAGGTGDIAFRFLKKSPQSKVTVGDINPDMLAEGKKNAVNRNILNNISFQCMDAQALPFEDNTFDYYTIAFGVRNVTDIQQALYETYRVLKPGGRFLCLEFSHINHDLLAKVYHTYSFKVIPKLGKILANDADSYRYLVESIRQFPTQHSFADMITKAGFSNVTFRNMTFSVVALHSGWKL